ncbi:MAG TPA: NifU family protein [Gammaproteobacteria bacterium]|nr:NifU family protein [Gammaproteobacteria bacterium]
MNSLAENLLNIHITPQAQAHFVELILKEDEPEMNLRIFLDRPGLPMAEVGITFCLPGEHKATDLVMDFDNFKLYVDKISAPFLQNAKIDYQTDNLGGQLAVTAPNLRGSKPSDSASLSEKIEYVLNSEINPNLAGHGGMVSLVEISNNNDVILRFGGGCHGCGMADVTLKQGIQKTLKEQFPEINQVIDATDHSLGENPYY